MCITPAEAAAIKSSMIARGTVQAIQAELATLPGRPSSYYHVFEEDHCTKILSEIIARYCPNKNECLDIKELEKSE